MDPPKKENHSQAAVVATSPSVMAMARAVWATDEEVVIDLSVIADELIQSLTWASYGKRDWSQKLRELSREEPANLARGASWEAGRMDASALRSCVGDPRCQALLGGRRRWAQALSLAGLLGDSDVPEEQFVQAASMFATWVVGSIKRLPDRFPNTRPGAVDIREAKMDAIKKTAESLLAFGSLIGIEKMEAKTLTWLFDARDRGLFVPGFKASQQGVIGLSDGELSAWLEAVSLGLLASQVSSPASGAPGRRL